MWVSSLRAICALALLSIGSTACVSARVLDQEADRLFHDRDFTGAAKHLEGEYRKRSEASRASGTEFEDELLYLLDWGLSLHQAGEYEASNAVFVLAEKHVWGNDYTSATEEVGTLLTSENTKTYRGEDFEKILIHVYKAMNYALLSKPEEALVEARLVDRKLGDLNRSGEKSYKQNGFARYLSGCLYESQREWDDAYIDYRKTLELLPGQKLIEEDLKRLDSRRGRRGPAPETEIIVIYQNGQGPRKVPREDFFSLPRFQSRGDSVRMASVEVDGVDKGTTLMLHDIEDTAIRNLDERIAGMLAKRVAGRVAKVIAANAIERRTNNAAVGALARFILIASDQADLRHWIFLPRDLQVFRMQVAPGRHEVRVKPIGAAALPPQTVEVRAGEKKFVNFRYLR